VLAWLAVGLVITAVIPRFSAKVEDGLERVAETQTKLQPADV
jgi:hypothetical protein